MKVKPITHSMFKPVLKPHATKSGVLITNMNRSVIYTIHHKNGKLSHIWIVKPGFVLWGAGAEQDFVQV